MIPVAVRKQFVLVLCTALCFLLSACSYDQGDNLLRLPNPPKVFDSLQKQIDTYLNAGGVYAPPVSGYNRQVQQTVDLNNDGKEEALVFLRLQDDKPLRILIYQLVGEDYVELCQISENAESIDVIRYYDMDGDGNLEILVGWQVGSVLKTLSVYALTENGAEEILSTNYTYFQAMDMRGTGTYDMVVIRLDPVNFMGSAELFYIEDNEMRSMPSIKLSKGIQGIARIQTGLLTDSHMALYISGRLDQNVLVSDVLVYRDGNFFNVSLNPESGVSDASVAFKRLYAKDLNEDGILDLPKITPLPGYEASLENLEYWLTDWYNYDSYGRVTKLMTTYYNQSDSWYLALPETWQSSFTVSNREVDVGFRTTVLAYRQGDQLVNLCKIYYLSGDNRVVAASNGGRFMLCEKNDIVYAAELFPEAEGTTPVTLDKETLKSMFFIIENKWLTGEVTG